MSKIITRKDAELRGLKFYFTGIPCSNGHISNRYTSVGKCQECQKLSSGTWRIKNPEKVKLANRSWKAANPDKAKEAHAKWCAENKDRLRKTQYAWNAANPEKCRISKAKWYASNKDRALKNCQLYNSKNPEVRPSITAKRRAIKMLATPLAINDSERFKIKKMYAACKRLRKLTGFAWAVDHIVPLSKGGKHIVSNMQLLPTALNTHKGNRLIYQKPFEWVADATEKLKLPWLTP